MHTRTLILLSLPCDFALLLEFTMRSREENGGSTLWHEVLNLRLIHISAH
jgi:hypothetical protein